MGLITWSDGTYQIHYAGETIVLLPKEYALFQFLYTWKNRAFSRNDLLDRVWPLEEPTDRTVDDHIYRLRKKLQKWSHLLTIDTVRGVGYRLTLKEQQSPSPSALNSDFSENIKKMLTTYHGMGMGAALQTLYANQQVLGFQMDSFYATYLRFVGGDFGWFVEDKTPPISDKLFYLFHLYHMTEIDSQKTLEILHWALKNAKNMPKNYQDEMQITAISVYAQAKEWEQAKKQLLPAREVVERVNSPGFQLFFQAEETLLYLLMGEVDEAEKVIQRSDEILQELPMQRELGSFTIARGLCLYHRQELARARRLVDEGLEVLRSTKFVPHLIYGTQMILLFLKDFRYDPEWERKYQKMWLELSEEYKFDYLQKKIRAIISSTI
ncbi:MULTISPECIES: winged helix-turn-helix domain-containing protein [Brevibacillus]|uniref:winged helix-turn-helix domain-containing protein n=1 Tax=Brevibacillus TaxID=55080 RepID=UPI000D10E362|nr:MULTISPECIES: winged helix-turn-helix domain-containing protein [Brevibacillus]MED1948854.1 winged helix-turn-helix domain-containing protein [Brevibacillus formosus]MED2001377.1 winged helix-turn-helix domain-containing protein [Brevibacillus formosus]MED2085462.1 winged helix-turn-helix domain-containing protein [Brevibacillus formosus]PSK21758.1 winged helix family transcriptional regulator [Brevibacillus sp. NRRL NRS-603]